MNDSEWCIPDQCPSFICGGPHIAHTCKDQSVVTARYDNPIPCPFCGTKIGGKEMTIQDILNRLASLVEDGAPLDAKVFAYQSQLAASGDHGLPVPGIVFRAEWSTGPQADFHAEDIIAVRMDIQLGDPQ